MSTLPTAGIIANSAKPQATALLRSVLSAARASALPILLESRTAAILGGRGGTPIGELCAACDAIVVLGGDGTMLQAVHDMGAPLKPVLGINLGSLGFLTCAAASEHSEAIRAIAGGTVRVSLRTMLDIRVERGGVPVASRLAVNDAVISRGGVSHLVRIAARVDGEPVTEFYADGLIVATPTGSTAYSLAAGGPIVAPETRAAIITPICPHVLTNRSLIVPDQSLIELVPWSRDRGVYLSVDGQELAPIERGDKICVRTSEHALPLGLLPGTGYFEVLRRKFKWGGSTVAPDPAA